MQLNRIFPGVHRDNLRGDFYGGVTAAVVALPLALAFGVDPLLVVDAAQVAVSDVMGETGVNQQHADTMGILMGILVRVPAPEAAPAPEPSA